MKTSATLFRVAALAGLTLACAGAPRAPAMGGLAYDPFYEGRSQWEIAATPEGGIAPTVPTQAPAPAIPSVPESTSEPTTETEPPAEPTAPAGNETPATKDTPEPVPQPSRPGYTELVAQALSLAEDQRAAFFASLAGASVNDWNGQVVNIEYGADRAILLVNLAPTADGQQDAPDARLVVAINTARQFSLGETVRFSGTILSARSEPGTDLLVEIIDAVVERVP
ncbi:MAG: hypothetical protein ACUVRU_03535 [Anaerolineae bacterium]